MTDTLSICEHMVPVKTGCYVCAEKAEVGINKRLQELERYPSLINHLDSAKNDMHVKLYNLDRRISNLEERIHYFEEQYILDRLEKIESRQNLENTNRNVAEKTEGLTFGAALKALKKGNRIGRWHRDDIYVYLKSYDEMAGKILWVHTINGEHYPWMPNHQELLANDWRIIKVTA